MKVFVTGVVGYIGSHVCKALSAARMLPVTYDNLTAGHRWAVKWGPLVTGDLPDIGLVRETMRRYDIGAVMHFAAHAPVGESVKILASIARTISLTHCYC